MKIKSIIKIRITGKNIERFLKRIMSKKIDLLEINKIDYKTIDIKIYDNDYDKIVKMKTIYDVELIDIYGFKKLKKVININKYLIFFTILGFIMLIFLTNIIFEVEVIHNDREIRNILYQELEKYSIKKYKMVKSYKEIEAIKEKILKDYPDKIEWLEIKREGVKYVVRVEERILNEKENKINKQHIVASNNAIIKDIYAESGDVIKNKNDYVKKGDIIISGNITLNDETKDTVMAKGTVYGEVWYNVKVEVPIFNYEKKLTGKTKNVLTLKIFNKRYELFNFNKFKNKDIKETVILNNNLLPISLVKEYQKEAIIIDNIYLKEEAIEVAYNRALERIKKDLKEKEKIINIKKLHVSENNSKIVVDYFVTVYKNIAEPKKITLEELDVRDN